MEYPKNNFPGGVWPVMLTPFTEDGHIDENGLRALVDWYIESGVKGLFAACQSSEIHEMNFEERMRIAEITVSAGAGCRWLPADILPILWKIRRKISTQCGRRESMR